MATLEQLQSALVAADKAGATDDAKKLATAIMAIRAGGQPAAQPEPPAYTNGTLGAQAGLAGRSLLKGAMALPAIGADFMGGAANIAQNLIAGRPGAGYQFKPTGSAIDDILDSLGLPKPQTPTEHIVGKAVELGSGAGAGAKLAQMGANAVTGTARGVLQGLSANPTAQVAAGMGAGGAGEQAKQSGAGFGGEMSSALIGGLLGGGTVQAVQGIGKAAAGRMATTAVDVEAKLIASLQAQGIDPASINPAIKRALMEDVTKALRQGPLDDGAVARLADYRRLGLTPTRGRLTLDPFDVTAEQNAMRQAAAMGARDAKLPQIAQGNNAGLLTAIDRMNPTGDRFATGTAAMAPILQRDAAMKAATDAAYSQARDQAGRSAALDGATFTRHANDALQKNLAPKLGAEVDQALNDIATGKTPLTVEYAEQLKTMLGRKAQAAKATNGDLAYAYGIVRQALDDAPLMGAPKVNPGNLPAVAGTVPPSTGLLGQDAIDAFNTARSSARGRFAWQESAPGIERALGGANADTFIRDNIISTSAGLKDVAALAREVGANPQAREAVRGALVQHLQDAGIGKGNTAQTANFSGRGWGAALDSIGTRKLALFFDAEEVAQLQAIGRVGAVETFQPRGSGVNNSNSATTLLGATSAISKYLKPLAQKLPFGQEAIGAPLNHLTLSLMQRGTQNVPASLVRRTPGQLVPPGGLLAPYALPLIGAGGLLVQP